MGLKFKLKFGYRVSIPTRRFAQMCLGHFSSHPFVNFLLWAFKNFRPFSISLFPCTGSTKKSWINLRKLIFGVFLLLAFGQSHNNQLRFDRFKIPLDGFFWDSNLFFFLDGSPFVRGSWCKIPLGGVSFEIVILLLIRLGSFQSTETTQLYHLSFLS